MFTTDQELAEFLLSNNMTNISVDLVKIIEEGISVYSENKEDYDSMIKQVVEFDYAVIDEFSEGGNKVPLLLQESAVFVDCGFLHHDFVSILVRLSQILQENNLFFYNLIEPTLN